MTVNQYRLQTLGEYLDKAAAILKEMDEVRSAGHLAETEAKYPGERGHLVYPLLFGQMEGKLFFLAQRIESAREILGRITKDVREPQAVAEILASAEELFKEAR
jgi:hypothetical protein